MNEQLTIGEVARRAGLTAKTIRFYEDEGLLPSPSRSSAGYRIYREADLTRLQLVQRLRLLGLPLATIKDLVRTALSDDCARFGRELSATIASQRQEVERRLGELQLLLGELDALEAHVRHCCDDNCIPAEGASQCDFCGLTSEGKEGPAP